MSDEYERERMRHVRVPDELWSAAQEAVKAQGDPSVSAIIREALTQYVRAAHRRQVRDGPARDRGAKHGTPKRGGRKPPPP